MRVCVYSIHLKEVSFGGAGFHAVRRDVTPQTDYEPPHWTPSHEYPVSYRRNAKMHVTTKWSVEPAGAFEGFFMAKGNNPWGLSLPEAVASVNGTTVTYSADCTTSFPNAIALYDPLVIYWWLYTFRLGWTLTGPSENPCYVTLADPIATPFHTLLYIGCSKAAGKTETTPTAEAIWGEFTDCVVWRKDDPTTLTYWVGSAPAGNSATLLANANGQCSCWAHFLLDSWKAQGISNAQVVLVTPNVPTATGFLVKEWTFSGSGSSTSTAPFVYVVNRDVFDEIGIAGQGNRDPRSDFVLHYVVRYQNEYYDPSYGLPLGSHGYASRLGWENSSLDGFWRWGTYEGLPARLVKKKDQSTTETLFSP